MMSAMSRYPGPTGPSRTADRPVCPAAALSFTLGLIALRLCWLPGVNCALALAAVGAGVLGSYRVARSQGGLCGFDEAVSGIVLGVIVLGLSTFFLSAFVAAWH
jgi:hypothetical protein